MPKKHKHHKPSEKRESAPKSDGEKPYPIWVALIGGIVTITVAVLGYPPLVKKLDSMWNSTPTIPVISSPVYTPMTIPVIQVFDTATQMAATPVVDSPIPTQTLTQIPSTGIMTPQILTNFPTGKAPLAATFRAGSFYVTYPDGRVETCVFVNVCSYTWDIRQGSNYVFGPEPGSGVFSYTFHKKGEYTVVVNVCRGEACNFAALGVTVR